MLNPSPYSKKAGITNTSTLEARKTAEFLRLMKCWLDYSVEHHSFALGPEQMMRLHRYLTQEGKEGLSAQELYEFLESIKPEDDGTVQRLTKNEEQNEAIFTDSISKNKAHEDKGLPPENRMVHFHMLQDEVDEIFTFLFLVQEGRHKEFIATHFFLSNNDPEEPNLTDVFQYISLIANRQNRAKMYNHRKTSIDDFFDTKLQEAKPKAQEYFEQETPLLDDYNPKVDGDNIDSWIIKQAPNRQFFHVHDSTLILSYFTEKGMGSP